MQNKRNYYRLLNVQFDAPAAVIKASYRAMMQKLKMHPDLGGSDEEARFLNEALETLLDEQKRSRYDDELRKLQPECYAKRFSENRYEPQAAVNDTSYTEPVKKKATSSETHSAQHCSFCGSESSVSFHNNPRWEQSARCRVCHSPMTKVSLQPVLIDRDQRQIQRLDCGASMVVKTGWPEGDCVSAELQDFSTKGAKMRTQCSLSLGQVLLITSNQFDAVAVVRHVTGEPDGSWLSGVQFNTLELRMPPGQLFSVTV